MSRTVPWRAVPEPQVWAVKPSQYGQRTATLHTLHCAMAIGADTVTEPKAYAMVRAGEAKMDCACAQ